MGLISDCLSRHVAIGATLESIGHLFADYPQPSFRVRLWDGSSWGASENPRFTLVVKRPNALRQMLADPTGVPHPAAEPDCKSRMCAS